MMLTIHDIFETDPMLLTEADVYERVKDTQLWARIRAQAKMAQILLRLHAKGWDIVPEYRERWARYIPIVEKFPTSGTG